ncbi:MAG: hypothetical protein ACXU8R_28310, partial [Xanthobacteraceae bacterium]
MTKAIRDAVAAPYLMRLFISPSFGLMHAGEWPGFIPVPRFLCDCEGFCNRRLSLRMNSNNPLAVELESEKDAACEKFVSNLFVTHFH